MYNTIVCCQSYSIARRVAPSSILYNMYNPIYIDRIKIPDNEKEIEYEYRMFRP